jgi:hypothetical protein
MVTVTALFGVVVVGETVFVASSEQEEARSRGWTGVVGDDTAYADVVNPNSANNPTINPRINAPTRAK